MKKFSLLLAMLMLASLMLTACGQSASSSAASESQPAESTFESASAEPEEEDEENYKTGDAALDNPRNQDEIGEKELLVVSFGTTFSEMVMPSKPRTEMSRGTRSPCSSRAEMAPMAVSSLKAKTAVNVLPPRRALHMER